MSIEGIDGRFTYNTCTGLLRTFSLPSACVPLLAEPMSGSFFAPYATLLLATRYAPDQPTWHTLTYHPRSILVTERQVLALPQEQG